MTQWCEIRRVEMACCGFACILNWIPFFGKTKSVCRIGTRGLFKVQTGVPKIATTAHRFLDFSLQIRTQFWYETELRKIHHSGTPFFLMTHHNGTWILYQVWIMLHHKSTSILPGCCHKSTSFLYQMKRNQMSLRCFYGPLESDVTYQIYGNL